MSSPNSVGYSDFMNSTPPPPTGAAPTPPDLASQGPAPTHESPVAEEGSFWAGVEASDILTAAGLLALGVGGALVVHAILFRILRRLVRGPGPIDEAAVASVGTPVLLLLIAAGVHIISPSLDPAIGPLAAIVRHALTITLIIATVWLLIRVLDQAIKVILRRYDTTGTDNLQARQVHTQVVVVRRILTIGLGALAAGAVLMTFPAARQIGTSILASAGIAGIAVGLAARPVIENLLAGLQIAFTQPLRLDDVVIMDGEWGRVEEITSTFVVVRIWDQRRLIVPLSKVISESFQNWTRRSADIMGTVFMYVDYTIPVEPVRAWLKDYVGRHPKWDKRVCVLQVTDVTERTVQLRALVSAANAGDAFDLRCDTREAMMAYIQREFPYALPQVRSPATGGAAQSQAEDESGE
jgi:small-conductance mechanosensitive channel